jgi:hypothetical protein
MISDQKELESRIRDAIENRGARLLAIDGVDGCGKTTLSDSLAPTLDCAVLHLDDFVEKNRGGFLDFFDFEKLGAEIQTGTDQYDCLIIEGVCVLEVLNHVGVKPDLHIYIKKLKLGFLWHDEDGIYGDADSFEEKIIVEEERNRKWSEIMKEPATEDEIAVSGLRRDIISYHWSFRPDERADVVFGNAKLG